MATSHGKNAVLKIADSGDVLQDLSSYVTSTGLPRSADSHDVTTLGSTSHKHAPGLLDNGSIPLEGQWDATVDGILDGILGVEDQSFEYFPAGEPVGASKPKYSGVGQLVSYEVTTPVDGMATFSAEFQIDGDVTRAVA